MSWLAVRTENADELLKKAGLKRTGEKTLLLDGPITLGHMPTGWSVVAFDHEELPLRWPWLAELSNDFDLIVGFVEEHVMVSSLASWRSGKAIWEVDHNAQKGIFDLTLVGDPPAELAPIKDKLMAMQEAQGGKKAGVDLVFDVATRLSKALTGFKHDESIEGLDEGECDVLIGKIPPESLGPCPGRPEKPSFFKRLFGG